MQTKNYFLTIFTLAILSHSVKSQSSSSRFYIKAYGGYGFSTPGSENFTNTKSVYSIPVTTTKFSQTGGLGKGLHYGAGLGYIINDFINVGIDGEYLIGAKISSIDSFSIYNGHFSNGVNTLEVTNSVLSIIPNITFKAISKPSYYIYTRIGIIVAINTKLEENTYDSSKSTASGEIIKDINTTSNVYSFKTCFGLQASVGIQFHLTGNLRGFAELLGNFLPATPKSLESITNSKFEDNLASTITTTYSKNIESVTYSKSSLSPVIYSPPTGTGTIDDPYLTQSTVNNPLSTKNINYLGINIGLVLRL